MVKEESLLVIKYEQFKRNKAALSLLWDLDARNHEVTLLKNKHIRLNESYGEGEIPYEAILLAAFSPILVARGFADFSTNGTRIFSTVKETIGSYDINIGYNGKKNINFIFI